MNNENVAQEIDRKNEIFIRELMSKESFMLDWYAGAVVPKNHPRYYDGRIEVNIRKVFNSSYGDISFGKDKYQVTDEVVNNLYNYIETNIDKLIKISLNQSTEMYEGVSDSLRIKYKSIYISISGINASSEEEKNEIYKIKDDIKNLICVNKEAADNIEPNDVNSITFEKSTEIPKNLLVRTSLSELYGYHSKNNISDEKSTLDYINKIDSIMSKYSFVSDENFVLLGRKKIIYDEINEILNGTKEVDNPLYFVLGSLEEFMCNNNFVYMSDSENWEKGWEDLRNRNDIYSQKNIICLEEKNAIKDIIDKIKNYISSKSTTANDNIEVSKMNEQKNIVPDSLKDFISFDEDGYAFANQKLPVELENDYNTFINNYYTNDNKVVNNIVNKINELPYNTETTIAELINYKPDVAFVSPLTQGIINNAVLRKCDENGIKLEENRDEIGGLAYFVKFKKVNEEKENIQNLFEKDENGAFIRLIIPSTFVRLILNSSEVNDMDLRGKKELDLTTDEVIVLKKYAYELSQKNN